MESNEQQSSDLPVTPTPSPDTSPATSSVPSGAAGSVPPPPEDLDPRAQLRELERAEAAPYLDYPPTPWWNYVAIAFWAAAYVATVGWWIDGGSPIVVAVVMIGLSMLVGAYLGWYQGYHGAPPALLGRKPREIRRAYRLYSVGVVVLVGVIVLAGWLGGTVVATVVAFVGAVGGFRIYEIAYARAAAAAKARLA